MAVKMTRGIGAQSFSIDFRVAGLGLGSAIALFASGLVLLLLGVAMTRLRSQVRRS